MILIPILMTQIVTGELHMVANMDLEIKNHNSNITDRRLETRSERTDWREHHDRANTCEKAKSNTNTKLIEDITSAPNMQEQETHSSENHEGHDHVKRTIENKNTSYGTTNKKPVCK